MIRFEDLTNRLRQKIAESEEGIWSVQPTDAGKIGHMQGYRRGLKEALDELLGAINEDEKETES